MAEYNCKNYTAQGGEKTVIGGELEILAGAKIKADTGATVEGFGGGETVENVVELPEEATAAQCAEAYAKITELLEAGMLPVLKATIIETECYVPFNFDNGQQYVFSGVIPEAPESAIATLTFRLSESACNSCLFGMMKASNVEECEATDVAGCVTSINDILTALKDAGIMATDSE